MMRGINDQGWRADLLADVLHVVRRLGLGPRQPDPAQPHAGLEVDRVRPGRRARVRPPARGQGRADDGARHPRPRDRRRLRPARRHRRLTSGWREPVQAGARHQQLGVAVVALAAAPRRRVHLPVVGRRARGRGRPAASRPRCAAVRRAAGVVDRRGEDRQRAVPVVGDLDDPRLLGPVDVRGGVDLPEAAAALRCACAARSGCWWRVAVDPGDDLRGARAAARPTSGPSTRGSGRRRSPTSGLSIVVGCVVAAAPPRPGPASASSSSCSHANCASSSDPSASPLGLTVSSDDEPAPRPCRRSSTPCPSCAVLVGEAVARRRAGGGEVLLDDLRPRSAAAGPGRRSPSYAGVPA